MQRFAAEVAAAALRAPRYWRREKALAIYDSALDVISIGKCMWICTKMDSATQLTYHDIDDQSASISRDLGYADWVRLSLFFGSRIESKYRKNI